MDPDENLRRQRALIAKLTKQLFDCDEERGPDIDPTDVADLCDLVEALDIWLRTSTHGKRGFLPLDWQSIPEEAYAVTQCRAHRAAERTEGMITDYKGPSNSREMFRHLVGETITGVLDGDKGAVVLILSSGGGVEITPAGAYWKVEPDQLSQRISARAAELGNALAALGTPGLEAAKAQTAFSTAFDAAVSPIRRRFPGEP